MATILLPRRLGRQQRWGTLGPMNMTRPIVPMLVPLTPQHPHQAALHMPHCRLCRGWMSQLSSVLLQLHP